MQTIWIEGTETAGIINDLALGFRKKGYTVFTFAQPNSFYNYEYDIRTHTFIHDLIKNNLLTYPSLTHLAYRILNKFLPNQKNSFFKSVQKKVILKKINFFLPVYNLHVLPCKIFKEFKEKNIKVIGYFLGSEIRVYDVFCKHYNIERSLVGSEYFNESFLEKAKLLSYFEKYAHCIFSVPDQMSLAKRPYFHLQLPFNTGKFNFNVPLRQRPLIIHCPSNSGIKGTSIITKVIDELRGENIDFDFELVQNKPHTELLDIMSNADILVDELILNGPGLLSFEAMASGCVVLTKHLNESPSCFKPPIISITAGSLKKELADIITNIDKRKECAEKGRDYLLKNNSLDKVINDMSQKLEKKGFNKTEYDYYPDFENIMKNILSKEQISQLSVIAV